MTTARRTGPKLTPEQCKAIHDEAHAAGLDAANKMETWFGCGFAWVNIKPATQSYAKWLSANGIARYSQYDKAMQLWVSLFGQNANKKYAYSQAYAGVLVKHNIYAIADSRAD